MAATYAPCLCGPGVVCVQHRRSCVFVLWGPDDDEAALEALVAAQAERVLRFQGSQYGLVYGGGWMHVLHAPGAVVDMKVFKSRDVDEMEHE